MDKNTRPIMVRQAAAARVMLEQSTAEQPLKLSPALFDKLRPEQRYRFRRG